MTDTNLTPDQARTQVIAKMLGGQATEAALRESDLQVKVLRLESALEQYRNIVSELTAERDDARARIVDLENPQPKHLAAEPGSILPLHGEIHEGFAGTPE